MLIADAFFYLFATVCVAAALQAATGAGLGLIVAPVLILILHSSAAVHVAIVLNLLISVLMLPREMPAVNWSLVRWLCLGTALGVPLGVWTLNRVAIDTLELVAGACVTLAALQLALVRARRRADAAGEPVERDIRQ